MNDGAKSCALDPADVDIIRMPLMSEALAIKTLIDDAVLQGFVLPRTLPELHESLRDFHVYVDERGIGGCVALHIDTADLAEIRSLVVRADLRGKHIGARLVEACIGEARNLGLQQVYALTRVQPFFEKLGFQEIDKHALPHKVFKDCVRCHLFPGCDEVAVIIDLSKAKWDDRKG